VNPTASISGLLDKLGGIGTSGRALSRALGEWERLVRDPECTVVLALATPVVAEGLREMLVHTIEQRYVDIVVASAADLIADLHESLGHFHYADGDIPVASDADRAHTTAFIARFAATFVAEHPADSLSGRDLARALGEALPTRAPRKGILQAAAAVGVAVYCPDLAAGPIGQALLAARTADGSVVRLNPLDDVTALARDLAARPRVGLIAVGTGAADALVRQAHTLAPDAALAGDITIGVLGNVRATPVEHSVVVATEATLALPLLITSLAQRLPSTRGARAGRGPAHSRQYAPTEEHAMA
jgi:deoxyhypusine synthase